MLDLRQKPLLLDPAHDVGSELVGGVVGAARGFAEADVAARHGDNGISGRGREGDMRVVSGGVDVQVVRGWEGRVVC